MDGQRMCAICLWAAGMLAAAGCNGQLTPQARELLESGTRAYQAGDYRLAVERMDAFLQRASKSRQADQALYIRGLAKYDLKDAPGAKTDLEDALSRTADRQIRAKASLTLGDLAFEAGDAALAETMYRQALDNLKEGVAPADHAHFRLGCVLQRQGRWRDADVQFSRVAYYFGGSELARRSKRLMNCNAWTIRAGAYGRRENADTAAGRFREKGMTATVEPYAGDGPLQYIVKVGRYADYAQAAEALTKVKELQADAFVTATE